MPRLMSFALTTDAVRKRQKTVTRRKGWADLKPGQLFWAVKKAMGLKPGEKVQRLALCRCVSNDAVALNGSTLTWDDVWREGFPGMRPPEFVAMFCEHMGGDPAQEVQRIAFEYVDDPAVIAAAKGRRSRPTAKRPARSRRRRKAPNPKRGDRGDGT